MIVKSFFPDELPVDPFQAAAFLVAQALVGLLVLLQFNGFAIGTGIASLVIIAVYPFMKRITHWPQIVLGLAFSWGALMGWAAWFGRLDPPAYLLYAGAIAWVIGYDTIYAHQDREDDALIGIKSTARLFGETTRPALAGFYALAVALIGWSGFWAGAGPALAAVASAAASEKASVAVVMAVLAFIKKILRLNDRSGSGVAEPRRSTEPWRLLQASTYPRRRGYRTVRSRIREDTYASWPLSA